VTSSHCTADRLKVGGFMVVDDTNIAPCLFLADFMSADPNGRDLIRCDRFSVHQKSWFGWPRQS
jgi:hypothetical protein